MTYALVLHGGAGARPGTDYAEQKRHMADLIASGQAMLQAGDDAVAVVTAMVCELEASGLYVAGKGSAPNTDGVVELDASIMDGRTRQAGAVAAVSNIVNPIAAARKVMQNSEYVMLGGAGARTFALNNGAQSVDDPDAYYTNHVDHGSGDVASHGTVGAVALALDGGLAAATSTGGTFNKPPGRIGDTPLIGAGTWADDLVAVSCTGVGEAFMRTCTAHDIAARMRYAGLSVQGAVAAALEDVRSVGGDGGVIAIDRQGRIAMPYNSQGMKRAAVSDTMAATVRVFEVETSE